MDKRTLPLIIVLALVIIFYYPLLQMLGFLPPEPEPTPADTTQQEEYADSIPLQAVEKEPIVDETAPPPVSSAMSPSAEVASDTIIVKTNKYEISLCSAGGGLTSLLLNEYTYRNSNRINLLANAVTATPDLTFAGETFSASKVSYTCNLPPRTYEVGSEPLEVVYTYRYSEGAELVKRYIFYPDRYHFDLVVTLNNREQFGFERQYQIVWNTPLGVTEPQPDHDYSEMKAVAMMADSRVTLDDFEDDNLNQTLDGVTSWAGVRSKYFAAVMIPASRAADRVFARGTEMPVVTEKGSIDGREVIVGLNMPFANVPTFSDSFTVFVGPLDYELMSSYDVGLEDMLGIGTTPFIGWLIKPFAQGVIWLLPRMYDFIPNYGLVIILFAFLVKLVTLPLSLKSFKSMQAMKELQPKLEELKKKHKKNPQALNKEMMQLYKTHGVNPISGCLPMLPQMPLFFALFSVFRSTILLRDAPFFWFINDLSRGASGLTDPYILLVLVMIGAQFASQKLTMASSQQNKALTYIMPLFMGFIFYKFAAGLVLYWTCFSMFSLLDYVFFKKPKSRQIKPA